MVRALRARAGILLLIKRPNFPPRVYELVVAWISLGVILPQDVEVVLECEVDLAEESRLVTGRLRILNSIWRTWAST